MKTRRHRLSGFTLIEILVVLALLGLIATMLPRGLNGLYERSEHQTLVQKTVNAARDCTVIAQRQQKTVLLGALECPLPPELTSVVEDVNMPLFFADGTTSHTAYIVIDDESRIKQTTIVINRLTANVSVE